MNANKRQHMTVWDGMDRAEAPTRQIRSQVFRAARKGVTAVATFGPLLIVPYAMWRLWQRSITPADVGMFLALYVATGLGITIGFHRLLTHRSFATSPVLKSLFLILGSMAVQGRCIDWAATHLKHHAHADRAGDPHSPVDGFFHAHMGWLLTAWPANRRQYGRHLLNDPVVVWIDRTAYLWVVVGLVLPYLIDGWRGMLWGGLVRIACYNQVTYAVNSICHTFGSRPFETKDYSRNNWLIAILTLGEGWHNNHHAFPSMAIHGMTRRQVDVSGAILRLLHRKGLVWDIKQPSLGAIARRAAAHPSSDSAVDQQGAFR